MVGLSTLSASFQAIKKEWSCHCSKGFSSGWGSGPKGTLWCSTNRNSKSHTQRAIIADCRCYWPADQKAARYMRPCDPGGKVHREPSMWPCVKEDQQHSGLHEKHCWQWDGHCPLLSSAYAHLEFWAQFWAPHYKTDMDSLKWVQCRTTKMIKGWEHLPHKERLRQTGLLIMEKAQGDLIAVN